MPSFQRTHKIGILVALFVSTINLTPADGHLLVASKLSSKCVHKKYCPLISNQFKVHSERKEDAKKVTQAAVLRVK